MQIGEVLDTNMEHAYDIVERALKATDWPEYLVTERAEIKVPERAGRKLELTRDEIKARYLSREELLSNPPANFHLVQHPMINHKLSIARDKRTKSTEFEQLIYEISIVLSVYATEDLAEEPIKITTPICEAEGKQIAGRKPAIVPIWRAGDGMKTGVRSWMTASRVGSIGMYRNHETLLPLIYYAKFPAGMEGRPAYLCDPMLATGVSSVAAIEILKSFGCQNIRFLSIISAAQGVNAILMAHPDVEIYTAALDEGLNEKAYIVPGLGDAGDRLFGTI